MTVKPQIDQLAERPELLPVVATWIYNEWWTKVPGASVEALMSRLQAHLIPDQIPLTLVASLEARPVGTATLLAHDVGTEGGRGSRLGWLPFMWYPSTGDVALVGLW